MLVQHALYNSTSAFEVEVLAGTKDEELEVKWTIGRQVHGLPSLLKAEYRGLVELPLVRVKEVPSVFVCRCGPLTPAVLSSCPPHLSLIHI